MKKYTTLFLAIAVIILGLAQLINSARISRLNAKLDEKISITYYNDKKLEAAIGQLYMQDGNTIKIQLPDGAVRVPEESAATFTQ